MNDTFKILKLFFNSLTAKVENTSTSDAPFQQTQEIINQLEDKVKGSEAERSQRLHTKGL